ncbi:MAG: hydrolase [Waddliaceae bacterium]
MNRYEPYLKWIYGHKKEMASRVEQWANIHSGSNHLEGLHTMLSALEEAFATLGGSIAALPLPPRKRLISEGTTVEEPLGKALLLSKHPDAQRQVFLGGHMDIALKKGQPLEPCQLIGKDRLCGRGTADMKGGLVILLTALQALEKSPFSGQIGWKVLITPDEELGSPGSHELLVKESASCQLGLLFEPSLPNGALVSSRKGSVNYTLVVQGIASHSGRDFHLGKNAITSLARIAVAAENLTDPDKDITVNIGHIEGGGTINIVPDRASCLMNLRVKTHQDLAMVKEELEKACNEEREQKGVAVILHQDSERFPKPLDEHTQALLNNLQSCASQLGFTLEWESTGGVCDGNTLAHEGLPTIDTLGVIGGNLHTKEEYMMIPSLVERSLLAAKFLMHLADERSPIPS